MHLEGEEEIDASKNTVWEALNNPEILKECIAGCSKIEKLNSTEFVLTMTASVGPVKAKFNGKLKLKDLDPPNAYTIDFNGSGGVAGFGKGSAEVKLIEENSKTLLKYTAEASVGGKLAQVGARLIDGVAKKMATDFFAKFKNSVHKKPAPSDENDEKIDVSQTSSLVFWALVVLALILLYSSWA